MDDKAHLGLKTGDEDSGVEITPEMIEAGVSELALFDRDDRGSWIVSAVYEAMEKVRRIKVGGTV